MSRNSLIVVPAEVKGRRSGLGDLGDWMANRLQFCGLNVVHTTGSDALLMKALDDGRVRGITAMCFSILHMEVPTQVSMKEADVVEMLSENICNTTRQKILCVKTAFDIDSKDDVSIFPLKEDPQAATKVNVFFRDVWHDIKGSMPKQAQQIRKIRGVLAGMYNDQAAAAVIFMSLCSQYTGKPVLLFARLATDPAFAKNVSNVLKACGSGQNRLMAMCCEANTLQGRGVGDIDLEDEIASRCEDGCRGKTVDLDSFELRRAVKEIIRDEIAEDRRPEWPTVDEFFSKRWLTTVNGSHNKTVHKRPYVDDLPSELKKMRMHRRAGVEVMSRNPLFGWDGETSVSVSAKLEHAKRRALFACDTVSYMAFDYLLKPVERSWVGRRVLLDPGKGGSVGMAHRISVLEKQYPYGVMLDYEAFNEHHTLEAQRIVIEEATRGADRRMVEMCLESFGKMRIRGERGTRTVKGTLMSGHRATSFINSVLNAAYIKLMLSSRWTNTKSIHVGDDVVVLCRTLNEARQLIDTAQGSPFRFNQMKQSFGRYSKEFLRMSGTGRKFYGYLARAVSSLVSGNWVTEIRLGEAEAISTYNQMAWSLVNRSGVAMAGRVLLNTIKRRTSLSRLEAEKLVAGELSVNGSPVRVGPGRYGTLRCQPLAIDMGEGRSRRELRSLPSNATDEYLAKHLTPVEMMAREMTGADVKGAMLEASYRKSLLADSRCSSKAVLKRGRVWSPDKSEEDVVTLVRSKSDPHVLDGYPLVHLVKSGLSRAQVGELCVAAGGSGSNKEIVEFLSDSSTTTMCRGIVPYADAVAAGRKAQHDVVASTFTVAM